jgi:hypothetical protein
MPKLLGFDKKGFERAARRGEAEFRRSPISAMYSERTDSIEIVMPSGVEIRIPRRNISELQNLTFPMLKKLRLSRFHDAIEIDACDIHISSLGLLRILVLGDDPYSRAGRSKSAAKTRAARVNGQKGGRPKKAA